jgi:hypothetical protein
MVGEALAGFEYFQQFTGLPVAFVAVLVKVSGEMERDGQVNYGVNLAWQALIHIQG